MADVLDTLLKFKKALDEKLINEQHAETLRNRILKITVAKVDAAPATVVTEDPTTRAAKEVRSALAVHIGSIEAPAMGKRFFDAIFLQPPDERVRTETATLLGGTPLKVALTDMFRNTDPGVVPAPLHGQNASAKLARLAAREWLARLLAPYAAWEMSRSNSATNRASAATAVITQISEDDASSVGFTLLSNLNKIVKTTNGKDLIESTVVAPAKTFAEKTKQQERQQESRSPNGKRPRAGDHQPPAGPRGMSCFFCGGAGHRQKECPEYASASQSLKK